MEYEEGDEYYNRRDLTVRNTLTVLLEVVKILHT